MGYCSKGALGSMWVGRFSERSDRGVGGSGKSRRFHAEGSGLHL